MNCQEYREIVVAHVNNVLTPLEREEVEHHVAGCVACREIYEQERAFRAFVAAKPLLQKVPPSLEQKLRSALAKAAGAEEQRSRRAEGWRRWVSSAPYHLGTPAQKVAVGLAVAGLFALLFLPQLLREKGNEGLLQEVAQDYLVATSPDFSLAFHTDDPQALEAYFNQSGSLGCKTRVLDFRKRGYRLKGGTIMKEGEKMVAVTLYEGRKSYILCRRFRGTLSFHPPGGERMGDHLIYTQGGLTFCFTQDAEMVCSLVTRIPRETFAHDLEAVFSQTS